MIFPLIPLISYIILGLKDENTEAQTYFGHLQTQIS